MNNQLEENKKVVVRFNKEFLEGGNKQVLKEIVADDFVNHTLPPGFPNDVKGTIQFVELIRKGFPDLTVHIHEQLAENDVVSSMKTLEGTHLDDFMGYPPTGKKVRFTVIDIVRIKDGKYKDYWGKNDLMQIIRQL